MKRAINILVFILLTGCSPQVLPWDDYQGSYRKEMIKDAREVAKSKREAKRDSIKTVRFHAKLERIKGN